MMKKILLNNFMSEEDDNLIRLHVHMAKMNIGSRRFCEKLIGDGVVYVDGEKIESMGVKINPDTQHVEVRGEVLEKRDKNHIVLMLNKPTGVVCSVKQDATGAPTVLDIIDKTLTKNERIFPIGRLDKDSSGLILLSNDGRLTYQLTHPSQKKEKEYIVTSYSSRITDDQIEELSQPLFILGSRTQGAIVTRLSNNCLSIVLHEGKNRQIRRMFRHVHLKVCSLHRVRIGQLALDQNLENGAARLLTKDEIQKVLQ
jgi:23S rRNA pseudouridine2605 synthase